MLPPQRKASNPTKVLRQDHAWFNCACKQARRTWTATRFHLGASHHDTRRLEHTYRATCARARQQFMQQLPQLLKQDPAAFYTLCSPKCKLAAHVHCTPQDYTAHCRPVFDLPAMGPPPICPNPNPTHLPFYKVDLALALLVFKGNKASRP